jgi:hypothetical protein
MMLVKNMLIKWLAGETQPEWTGRILWIDPAKQYVFIFGMDDPAALPVRKTYDGIVTALNEAEALIVFREEAYALQAEEQFTQKQQQRRDQNWALIEPIVTAGEAAFIPAQRHHLIEAAEQRTGRAKRLIYEYLRRYWRAGQLKNALIPRHDRSGLPDDPPVKSNAVKRGSRRRHSPHPGINIDAVIKKRLQKGYQRFYVSGECKTLTEAYRQTLLTFFRSGEWVDADGVPQPILPPKHELPTLFQFKYHCHYQRDRQAVLIGRKGQSRMNTDHRPKLGSALQMAFGPGSWYLIDSTPADFLLVSSLNRSQILGKPTLYFVKDLFSLLIVGFEVSLEAASWVTQVLAIENATREEVVYRNLLPRAEAIVSRQGIEFKELHYFSQYGHDQQWYLKAGQKRRKVSVAYDPRTTDYIFLCLKGQAMEQCALLERDQGYVQREWVEVEAQKRFEAAQRVELEDDRFAALAELDARLKHIAKPAEQAAAAAREQAGLGPNGSTKNQREHLARERELERRKDTQAAGLIQYEVRPAAEQLPTSQQHLYIPHTDYSDIINEAIEEEQHHG